MRVPERTAQHREKLHVLGGFFAAAVFMRFILAITHPKIFIPYPPMVYKGEMRIDKEQQKLVARIKRIGGQVDSIERSLTTGSDWLMS